MSPQHRTAAVRRGLIVTISALTLAAVVATPNALAASGQANARATTPSSTPSSAHADGQTAAFDHSGKGTRGTSGDSTQPQPTSNADQNSGGATGQCAGGGYCSTRDGSASGNGNGGGNATGKPCAGCVGKADNKNPAGQAPNGSDANAGYECDRNHGIGRSNPAHTGCTTSSGGTDCTVATPSGSTCTAVLGETVVKTSTAKPPTMTPSAGTQVLGERVAKTPTVKRSTMTPSAGTQVLGESMTRAQSRALPFTGANTALMAAIASMTLLGGVAMTVAARKRRHSTI